MPHTALGVLLAWLLCLGVSPTPVLGDEVVPQVEVTTSNSSYPTLAWPRWKAYMSPDNPDDLWISYGNSRGSAPNLSYSTDGGVTWNSNVIQINFDGYVDDHLGMFGQGKQLFFTWPGSEAIKFRRFDPPAQSDNDRGPLVSLANTTYRHRANIMVEPGGRIWIFTREAGDVSANVRYQYSDNDGSTWTGGVAVATNCPNVRFGSMPYLDGHPALVVLHLDDDRGYEYYLWNGTSFEARPDHSIYADNMGQVRDFAHTVVNDSIMHLFFGYNNELHHVWKNNNGGTGSWNYEIVETSNTTPDMDWSPAVTVRGPELYLFYQKNTTSDPATAQVYYRRWTSGEQVWTAESQISDPAMGSGYFGVNTCFQVPEESDYIPVFWADGGADHAIYYSRILVDPLGSPDTTPPATTFDLSAVHGSETGSVDLAWTAPGDDGMSGSAVAYVIKYSSSPITDATWSSALTYPSPPPPQVGGQPQSVTLTGFTAGERYYFALRAFDERNNVSGVSNSPAAYAAGINAPAPTGSEFDSELGQIDLSCSAVNSYLPLLYQFALDSTPSFPQPDIKETTASGGEASVVYANIEPETLYHWRCRAVASDLSDSSAWSSPFQVSTVICCTGIVGNTDCDPQEQTNLTDLTTLINILFTTFSEPCCFAAADLNPDGVLNLTDLTVLVNALFVTYEPLPACP